MSTDNEFWIEKINEAGREYSRRQLLLGGAAGLGVALVGTSALQGGIARAAPARQPASSAVFESDTLVWAYTSALTTLDPSVGGSNLAIIYNVYQRLLDWKVDELPDGNVQYVGGGEVAPQLAETWDVEDGTVTFHLRHGVRFHPTGNELTADDVKFSFVRAFSAKGSTTYANGVFAGVYDPDDQIEVVDRYTVRFTFVNADGEPHINPMSLASLPFWIPILEAEEVRRNSTDVDGNQWGEEFLIGNTVGTGPYYVADQTPGVEVVLEYVGDDIFTAGGGEPPYFKRVIVRTFQNYADIVPLLKQGEVHGVLNLPIPELEDIEQANIQTIKVDTPNAIKYFTTLDHPALENKLVRQALAFAVPHDQIIEGIYGGRAVRALSFVNPNDPSFEPVLERYSFDLDRARELIAESGVATPFDLQLHYDSGNTLIEDIALLLQDTWSQLDINVSLAGLPGAQYTQAKRERLSELGAGNPTDLLRGVLIETGAVFFDDAQPIVEFWLRSPRVGTFNYSDYSNAEIDELHATWGSSGDADGRNAAYGRIQEIAADELPWNAVTVHGVNLALAPGLTGYRIVADENPRYWALRPVE